MLEWAHMYMCVGVYVSVSIHFVSECVYNMCYSRKDTALRR